jgi:hypothetical protein
MPSSNLLYQALTIIPSLWFVIPISAATGLFLFFRGLKPAASGIIALSAPGTVGAALTFLFAMFYKLQTSIAPMHFSMMLSLLMVVAFPIHVISPLAFFFALCRYISEKNDYATGFGYIVSVCLIISSIALSHILVTSPSYDM